MERLTERDGLIVHSKFKGDWGSQNILHRLAEYEDAEEDGLLIRLPCKVGDVVYVIQSNGKIARREADMMFLGVLWDEYGKEWFITEAEAEQALAKMKGE